MSWKTILIGAFIFILIVILAVVWYNTDCYQLGLCHSKSLPSVSHFVGREEDIRNITGYLDFHTSDVQVVHIVGPPGFGKSTLAMKIGEIFVRKCVKVFYADLRMIKDVDSMSEIIMHSIVSPNRKHKATYIRLEKWVRNRYSNTLIILDNCDELFVQQKDKFLDSIRKLTQASSSTNVRYLLTSQHQVADIGNFRLHAIYTLSPEAAIQLLGALAPSLTDDQKRQIAYLTGNVPLALEVVGAIFINIPVAPTAEEVIQGLQENLIDTLSTDELNTKVDASITIAYSYLRPELKELCVNLSYFPGDFDKESARFIYNFKETMLHTLVRRSLLQHRRHSKRYFFHQLLRTFFIQKNNENADIAEKYFSANFQLYFANFISHIIPNNGSKYDLSGFINEEHNILRMFVLFGTHKDVNITFYAIKVITDEFRLPILSQLLYPGVYMTMLGALMSYTPYEITRVESFLETYIQVVILAANRQKETNITLTLFDSAVMDVKKAYVQGTLSLNTFTKFFRTFAQHLKDKGYEKESVLLHAYVLRMTRNKLVHCFPDCDFFSISVAYEEIGDRELAFYFRQLTYQHQYKLEPISEAELFLKLYSDYSDATLGNDLAQAMELSARIIEEIYPYLLMADKSEYSEEVYFAAIQFFKEKSMQEHELYLQKKMFEIINQRNKCKNNITECFDFASVLFRASRYQFYHLAAMLGKEGLSSETKSAHLLHIVGESLYSIGNYSESQELLTKSLELVNA